jgi:hypothetical protein
MDSRSDRIHHATRWSLRNDRSSIIMERFNCVNPQTTIQVLLVHDAILSAIVLTRVVSIPIVKRGVDVGSELP